MTSDYQSGYLEQEFERYAVLLRTAERTQDSKMASEILQAFAAFKNVIDGLRNLNQYASEVKDIQNSGEFMRIIGQLNMEMAEIQLQHVAQVEKIRDLTEEVERLKKPEIELVRENGLYYDPNDKKFPFCPHCYVKDKSYSVLSYDRKGGTAFSKGYCCPECEWKGQAEWQGDNPPRPPKLY